MKIVIAPDSFKGALRSHAVASFLADGWRRARSGDEVVEIPLADGGEGTAEALRLATGGRKIAVAAHDALSRPHTAEYVILGSGDTAVVEVAAASGIEALALEELSPLSATTFGSGEVFLAALKSGVPEIVVGLGGSATLDGGAGFLQAMGVKYYDSSGALLPNGIGGGVLERIESVDVSELIPLVFQRKITIACDVINPLLGANGAAAVFGPQKGATPENVAVLERNLRHWAGVLKRAALADECDFPGDGAAGGLGFVLRNVLRAKTTPGAKMVIKLSGLPEALANADLLITGEGCTDEQSLCGKLCVAAASAAADAGVPAVLCSGSLRGDTTELERCFAAVFSIASGPGTLAEAIADTGHNLLRAGSNLAGLCSAFLHRQG